MLTSVYVFGADAVVSNQSRGIFWNNRPRHPQQQENKSLLPSAILESNHFAIQLVKQLTKKSVVRVYVLV